MICEHCKAEIKDGLDYCMECGEPIEDKVIITSIKDIPLEAQPFLDFGGYVKGLTTNPYNIMAFVGAMCLYLSPFFAWIKGNINGKESSADLFDIGAQYGDFAINKPTITILGILILVAGLGMLAMSGREYIKPLKPYADMLIIRFIPAIFAIAVFAVQLLNKGYKNLCSIYDVSVYKCVGPILCVVGIAIYILSIVMEKNKRG